MILQTTRRTERKCGKRRKTPQRPTKNGRTGTRTGRVQLIFGRTDTPRRRRPQTATGTRGPFSNRDPDRTTRIRRIVGRVEKWAIRPRIVTKTFVTKGLIADISDRTYFQAFLCCIIFISIRALVCPWSREGIHGSTKWIILMHRTVFCQIPNAMYTILFFHTRYRWQKLGVRRKELRKSYFGRRKNSCKRSVLDEHLKRINIC